MVQDYTPPPGDGHRLPGLSQELMAVYEGMSKLGANSPTGARDAKWLAKQLHINRKEMEHDLHILEGKGVVGHASSGHEMTWYLRK